MPAGCPRTVSFEPKEMIALGKEMLEWVKNHPDILHLSEWYTIEKMFTYKQWKTFKDREEFMPYYEASLKLIGRKYIDKTSNVRDSISHRWQRVYFADLREEEDETARFNQSLKDEQEQAFSPELLEKYNKVISVMSQNQARNIEESNNNTESIS